MNCTEGCGVFALDGLATASSFQKIFSPSSEMRGLSSFLRATAVLQPATDSKPR